MFIQSTVACSNVLELNIHSPVTPWLTHSDFQSCKYCPIAIKKVFYSIFYGVFHIFMYSTVIFFVDLWSACNRLYHVVLVCPGLYHMGSCDCTLLDLHNGKLPHVLLLRRYLCLWSTHDYVSVNLHCILEYLFHCEGSHVMFACIEYGVLLFFCWWILCYFLSMKNWGCKRNVLVPLKFQMSSFRLLSCPFIL